MAMSISVLILTLDEEVNIGACLDTLGWCDDVVVLDSHSTDRTVELARGHGARVVERSFDNYAAQRNFGLNDIQYRNPWVLMLDADERVTPELQAEMLAAVRAAAPEAGLYMLRRRDHLFGRWIRRSSGYPTWFGRLARVGRVRVERPINEEYHADGTVLRLQHHLDHFPFNKGFSEWVGKHDRYSTMEAELRLQQRGQRVPTRGLLSADPLRRRKALKAMGYAARGRPLLMFLGLFIVRGGFLEGRAGFTFCVLRAWYEFMIDLKYRELRRREQGLPV
jgi:glycosyltransferase involved in cell wall biosynthesis